MLVQDEAIFASYAIPERVYTPPRIRAVCHVSRTHDRTIVYGVLGLDGKQIFYQYDKFNGPSVKFLIEMKEEFGRALLIMDRAPQHSARVIAEARKHRRITGIRLAFLSVASSELSAVEECWRQSKRDQLKVSYVTMGRLRQTINECFANKTFGLDILKYLMRSLRRRGAAKTRRPEGGCAAYVRQTPFRGIGSGTAVGAARQRADPTRRSRSGAGFSVYFVLFGLFE